MSKILIFNSEKYEIEEKSFKHCFDYVNRFLPLQKIF